MRLGGKQLLACKLAFSIGLLVLLYRKTPVAEIGAVIGNVDVRFFFPIALLLLANTVLSALKWYLFLRSDGVEIPLSTLTVTYLIGSFYNLFLPSNIGGDGYRIYDIARKSREGVRSAASVFADRFSGFLALVFLSLTASVPVTARLHDPRFILLPLVIFLGLLVIVWALFRQTPARWFLQVTRLDRFDALRRLCDKFFLSFATYGRNRRLLCQVMLISFAFQLSVVTVVYLLALSLHVSISYFYFLAFVPLITLLEALPISIYGIGIRDAGYVFFFSWAGMGNLQTRSLALLFLAVTVVYALIGGLFYLGRIFFNSDGAGQPGVHDGA